MPKLKVFRISSFYISYTLSTHAQMCDAVNTYTNSTTLTSHHIHLSIQQVPQVRTGARTRHKTPHLTILGRSLLTLIPLSLAIFGRLGSHHVYTRPSLLTIALKCSHLLFRHGRTGTWVLGIHCLPRRCKLGTRSHTHLSRGSSILPGCLILLAWRRVGGTWSRNLWTHLWRWLICRWSTI